MILVRTKRRHSTGFGYIGFGNNSSVFNRKPRKVFSETKDKLNLESHKRHQLNYLDKKLSLSEKNAIKNRIRKAEKERVTIVVLITVLIIISVIVLILNFKHFNL